MLEIESLGYLWKGEELAANATYSCRYCHQRWIKLDDELIKCVSVTEVGNRKPYQRKLQIVSTVTTPAACSSQVGY